MLVNSIDPLAPFKVWMCCNFVVEPKVGVDDRKLGLFSAVTV
jgi:hypothetical protein